MILRILADSRPAPQSISITAAIMKSPNLLPSLGSALAAALSFPAAASAAFPPLKLELVADLQLLAPLAMTHAGDGSGRSFIVEQRGAIRIFRNGMLLPAPFLDIRAKLVPETPNYDERGLLGLAFHPGYANAASPGFGRFYVFYMEPSPNAPGTADNPVNCRTVISEFRVSSANPNLADPASERVLLKFDKPQSNHGGGCLAFGPDNLLYFTVGDGGGSNDNGAGHTGGSPTTPRPTNAKGNAQDLTKIFGKMHRIDPLGSNAPGGQYGIPADNPFASSPNGERPEIYAFGLRNCWRFSFDKRPGGTNRLFAADVGQNAVEEINLINKGGNYGWRNREGSFVPSFAVDAPPMSTPAIDPIGQYAHPGIEIGSPPLPQIGVSVSGGYLYRGSAIPALQGKYVFGDWSRTPIIANAPPTPTGEGVLLGLEESPPGVWKLATLDILGGNPIPRYIQSFGEDEAGELYVLTKRVQATSGLDGASGLPSGSIYKIVPVPPTTALPLNAARDNFISQEDNGSNGAGSWIFAGATEPSKNQAAVRRALLGFTLTSIPAGATVASASLQLTMDRTIVGAFPFSLHRMTANWGEGTANAGAQEGAGITASATDATWSKPFHGQPATWASPGGDFLPTPSATTSVNNNAAYSWSGPALTADLNAWLANPAANFGWILKADSETIMVPCTGSAGQSSLVPASTDGLSVGMKAIGPNIRTNATITAIDDAAGTVTLSGTHLASVNATISFYRNAPSAKRFASRTGSTTSARPRLTVNYVPATPPPATRRKQWEAANYLVGQYIDDAYDTDGDSITDGLEYAWGFQPNAPNILSSGFSVSPPAADAVTLTFRRDPLATDLTYRAQVSTDMVSWSTIATSTAGATPTGPGFVSESTVDVSFRSVTVRDSFAAPSPNRFYRLSVSRQ